MFVSTVTQPSCTSCQPATLAWPRRPSSRIRRASSSSALHLSLLQTRHSLLPLQMAPHLRTGGLTPHFLLDSVPILTLVRCGLFTVVYVKSELFKSQLHMCICCFTNKGPLNTLSLKPLWSLLWKIHHGMSLSYLLYVILIRDESSHKKAKTWRDLKLKGLLFKLVFLCTSTLLPGLLLF